MSPVLAKRSQMVVTRWDLQALANERLLDAEMLLTAGRWSGAYYLAGYAVECGLKACIAMLTDQDDFPRDKNFVQQCYTHEIDTLVKAAGLSNQRVADARLDAKFGSNWMIVKDWNETARYQLWSELLARKMFEAVSDPSHGVLQWIRVRW